MYNRILNTLSDILKTLDAISKKIDIIIDVLRKGGNHELQK